MYKKIGVDMPNENNDNARKSVLEGLVKLGLNRT